MSSSIFIFSFLILLFSILLETVCSNPLNNLCSNGANFSVGSIYEKNLQNLLLTFRAETPFKGFSNGSEGRFPDQTIGLTLCRGDVSPVGCYSCLAEASNEITKRCLHNKEAIIWYDHCLLRYSNKNFLGQVDNQTCFPLWSVNGVHDALLFNNKTKELLSWLAREASGAVKMYAAGELEIDESRKIYGLAQCTRDLSKGDCKKCLDDVVRELGSCCYGREGGRVVCGSCNVRYDIRPFLED